jgi:GH25 family lysozyme M1 (1,4-beta-N-acetylmuramidase)
MLNKGNDWPSLYAMDPVTYSYAATYPDYTSDACDAMIANAKNWEVGDRFVFTNIDIANKKNPSPTPYVNWYDESYKCVAGFKPYGEGTPDVSDPDVSDPDVSDDVSDPDVSDPDISDIPVPPPTLPRPTQVQEAGIPGSAGNIAWGCDISFYNVDSDGYSESDADYSLVDFKKMKADGCDFVILRLGSEDSDGRYYDPHFVTLYNMAREAGMDIGLYFYSYALTYEEAAADAEFVMDVIEDHGMYFEYPLYIDIEEEDQLALNTSLLSNVCYGWCEAMEANGYFPGIYGNYSLYEGVSSYVKNSYDFWIAWVSSADSISTYTPWDYNLSDECAMWQYSFYGYEYDGIGLDMLDVNVAYKDYPALMEKYGFNNINGTGNNILSGNYYPDANTRTDEYADDQKKLTDGSKGSLYGGEGGRYSGWYTDSLDIIVETEGVYGYNTFNVYAATNDSWGIADAPIALTVSVSDSLNGEYKKIAYSEDLSLTATGTDGWSTYMLTAYISGLYNKKFVKFTLTPVAGDDGKGHIWLDEIEVSYTADVNPDDTDDATDPDDDNDTETYARGDVNGDGKVNMFDYLAVKAYCLDKSTLTDEQFVRADLSGDGIVNMFDYIALKNLVVKG